MTPSDVRLWIDPSCPWAWQALRWLLTVRDRGRIELTYSLFSLEINAHALERNDVDPGLPFAEAAPMWGQALAALALARRDGGNDAVEALLVALGNRRHDAGERPGPAMFAAAAGDAGMPDVFDRAAKTADLGPQILLEYAEARALDVFGVPTLQIGDAAAIFGPIISLAPAGQDALALWDQVEGVAVREGFFELKRWPRSLRPGESAPDP